MSLARKSPINKVRKKARPGRKYEVDGVLVYPDGREVCLDTKQSGRTKYLRRTAEMGQRQYGLCAICRNYMFPATFDHEAGRGAGKRDDRIEVGGEWKNAALCVSCNGIKGSKRYAWIDGKYQPVEKAA